MHLFFYFSDTAEMQYETDVLQFTVIVFVKKFFSSEDRKVLPSDMNTVFTERP